MKHTISKYIAVCTILLSACGMPMATPTSISPTATPAINQSTTVESTATPTSISPTATPAINQSTTVESTATLEAITLPLSESGSYHVGIKRGIAYEDPSRNGRRVSVVIWYPAIQPQDATGNGPTVNAMPDLTNAPYPLILSSSKMGGMTFSSHLTSYGFVYVGINGQDSAPLWGQWLTDYPLDFVFALNQIAANPPEGLAGLIDTEHAGALGYSFDGYTSLALSGARVDPEFYLSQCSNAAAMNPAPPAWWIGYICYPTGGWDEFVRNAGLTITTSNDGLWVAMTDERIRAVMPMAPEGAWLFGERGLAAADRPTLIIGATADTINIYDLEAVYIFEHLSTADRTMISFVDSKHGMIYGADQLPRMKHFAVAFFGYHLQGHDDYFNYFSEDFVTQFDDLAWGVYSDE
jgi:predicted dienelactone hydrolase